MAHEKRHGILNAMKICVVTQQLRQTITGPGLHANNLIHQLQADGHQVWVVAPADQKPLRQFTYHFIPVSPPLFASNQARWVSLAWNFNKALRRLIKHTDLDIIHFTDARESLFFSAKIPTVGNINDTYSAELHPLAYYQKHYFDAFKRWAYYRMVHVCERIALNRLKAVIANSQFTAQTIRENYHLPDSRLHVFYKSVKVADYKAVLDQKRLVHPPRILFVGTNMQRKGLPTLIQAAGPIIHQHPDVQFWVVGKDPSQPRLQALCQEYHVEDAFEFLGWKDQKELPAIYCACDILAMPSLTEAFGVVLLEAMASGVNVVATRVGGIPEIIQDGQNGLLVPPDNPEQLACAINKLLDDRELMQQLASRALCDVKQFDLQVMMDHTYRLYQALTTP